VDLIEFTNTPTDARIGIMDRHYREDLARIHATGFGAYADSCAPGVLALLNPNSEVLEIGCGGGALTRHLLDAGHTVVATDASPAMLDLAAQTVPKAELRLLVLPDDPIPPSDAIVSVGHVVNYLSSAKDIESAVLGMAEALTDGGIMIIDVCDLAYGDSRPGVRHATVDGVGWSIDTTTVFEPPDRFIRGMTTRVDEPDGKVRTGHETHINVLIDTAGLMSSLVSHGHSVSLEDAIGSYRLPEGMRMLTIRR
jgi:SAM-dependent methyltransferase